MLSFIGKALGLVPSLISQVTSIASAISNLEIAKLNATTDVEKATIQLQINQMQARQAVLIADAQHSNLDEYIRIGFALPPMIYFGKIYLWDKVWASWPQFETPPLETNDVYVLYAVLGFFLLSTAMKIFK